MHILYILGKVDYSYHLYLQVDDQMSQSIKTAVTTATAVTTTEGSDTSLTETNTKEAGKVNFCIWNIYCWREILFLYSKYFILVWHRYNDGLTFYVVGPYPQEVPLELTVWISWSINGFCEQIPKSLQYLSQSIQAFISARVFHKEFYIFIRLHILLYHFMGLQCNICVDKLLPKISFTSS